MSTPQDEAITIFKSVLDGFFGGTIDIKNFLRRCFHTCQILDWSEQQDWFNYELQGYPDGAQLPTYRKIVGHTKWIATGGIDAVIDSVVDDRNRTTKEKTKPVTLDVWAGVDRILAAAKNGYTESTGEKSSRYIGFRNRIIQIEEFNNYDPSLFQTIIKNIENLVFDFVSKSYSLLCYGDALQDIWQAHRSNVDKTLVSIGFSGHLNAIRAGLNSPNEQQWRTAMWSCRDVLHDLADYLWKDPRDTYDRLPGKDGNLRVTKGDYINRLAAYLHYKGTTGETGAYLRAEMERIYHSIDTLNDLDSKAHDKIKLADVRTAAIGTYIILGEIVTRTDMQPVLDYINPVGAS